MGERNRRVGIWTAAGLLGTGMVAGAVVSQLGTAAADSSSPTTQTQPADPPGGPGFGPHRGGDGFGALGRLGKPLYGDLTVQGRDGQQHTYRFEIGTRPRPATPSR